MPKYKDPRILEFKKHLAAHRTIADARRKLLDAIQSPGDRNVVFLVGATGVGKTTLLQKVERDVAEQADSDAPENRGRVPVVRVEARAPERGSFSWAGFYQDALLELSDPHVGSTRLTAEVQVVKDGVAVLSRVRTRSDALRETYERALANRQPAAVLVDEGHSIAMVASGRRLADNMEILKSLANRTETVHVLVGTYDLQNLLWHSGQLARRSRIIHFPPYEQDSDDDIKQFAGVLQFFADRLPLKKAPTLVDRTDYFFERAGGLVGILSTWISDALAKALQSNAEGITKGHLEATAPSAGELKAIRNEMREGQRFLESLLSGEWGDRATPANGPASPSKRSRSLRKAVGRRNPVRDPVGQG